MARVVICPSCQAKGSVPDGAQVTKIRCPKCQQLFDVKGASQTTASGTVKKPAAPKRPAAAQEAFGDLEDVQPLAPISSSGVRRAPGKAGALPGQSSGQSPAVFAALGIGGLAVVLLAAVLVVVMSRGGGEAPQRAAANSEEPNAPPVADATNAPPMAPAIKQYIMRPAGSGPMASADTSASSPSYGSPSQAIDSAEVVRRLKDATVYLKHTINGRTFGSGTGFVIKVEGDMVTLATNRHVAMVDLSDLPPRLVPKGAKHDFEAVFRSGLGPQQEQTVHADIIAADTSEEFSTDLAILVCRGVKRPPTPLSVKVKSETTEGMAYTGAGFPLGGTINSINDNKGNPSVTITGGRISALRRDQYGHVDVFQVDGSLLPGNSGGPLVEEKTGKLIGVAVAKRADYDAVGFVVPAEQLRQTLAGRIGNLDLTLKAIQKDSANVEVKAEIVDPNGAVQAVLIHAAPASAAISPNNDGKWPPLPNTTPVELKRDTGAPHHASGQIQVSLSGDGAKARKILLQTAHRDASGVLVYSKPREIELPEKPGRVMVSSQMLRIIKAMQRKTFAMLGPLIDPENNCKLIKDEDSMKIKIEVPGGKVKSLAPYIVNRINKKKPLHNAPLTLIEVEGDFAALVEVTGDWSPGTKLPKDRQGNDIPFTFNGAGLILYQDKDNFVRFERTAGVAVDTLQPITKILFEVVQEGKHVENQNYPPVREGPVALVLMRRKGRVWCGASLNLGAPAVPIRAVELDLPAKVKIGLSASNISAKPLTAQFENFVLINNETQLDALFGDVEVPKKKSESGSESGS